MAGDLPGINDDRGQTIQGISDVSFASRVPVSIGADPTTHELLVKASISGGTATSIASFQASVTTAGTRVQLASNACISLTIKAKPTNTGYIYVGDSSVSSSTGFILSASDSISYDVDNTDLIYIDSSVNGEGVSVTYAN